MNDDRYLDGRRTLGRVLGHGTGRRFVAANLSKGPNGTLFLELTTAIPGPDGREEGVSVLLGATGVRRLLDKLSEARVALLEHLAAVDAQRSRDVAPGGASEVPDGS